MIVNNINDKKYIGQTTDINRRMSRHNQDAKNGKKGHLYESIRKYGADNFSYYILEEAYSKKDLDDLEMYYIELYNTFKGYGYNKSIGGEGHGKGEYHPFYGQTHTKEARKRIGVAHKDKTVSEDTRRKMSKIAKINNKGERNPNAKLSEKDVIKIIELLNSKKYKQEEIADMFNVNKESISKIKCGRTWKYLHHLVDTN